MRDWYDTIARESEIETKIKGSIFRARAFEVGDKDAIEGILARLRKAERDATHHCFAYQLGLSERELTRNEFRYSDDGEPSGSAGKPIYNQITGKSLENVLVVVTRYFGGTKLGVGGLVRAYGDSASQALEISGNRRIFLCDEIKLCFGHSDFNRFEKALSKVDGTILEKEFSAEITLTIKVRKTMTERFLAEFQNLTSGKGRVL
ncbi:MAG: YigZ family protein [candidate division Zixibacteria bacterium]|nr:YigZ family protein [candidate division Zixibacteria bacterium]